MIVPSWLAVADPQVVLGWTFLVLGLGMFAWVAFDCMIGETRMSAISGMPAVKIIREQQPHQFQHTVGLNICAGVLCLLASAFLLIAGI